MTYDIEDTLIQSFVEKTLERLESIEDNLLKIDKSELEYSVGLSDSIVYLNDIKHNAELAGITPVMFLVSRIKSYFELAVNEPKLHNDEIINTFLTGLDSLIELVGNITLSDEYDIRLITNPIKIVIDEQLNSEDLIETFVDNESGKFDDKSGELKDKQSEAKINGQSKEKISLEQNLVRSKPTPKKEISINRLESTKVKKKFNPYSAKEFRNKYSIKKEIDLKTGKNPLGMSKAATTAISQLANSIGRNCLDYEAELKLGLAFKHDVDESSIVVDNSVAGLLDGILRQAVMPGVDHVLSYENCLPEYSIVSALCGAELLKVRRARNYALPLDEIINRANENTAAVILTNPDEPTGYGVFAEEIATMANFLPKRTLLIIDERAVQFAWPEDDYSMLRFFKEFKNLVVLRNFSWSFGVDGLSLGYGVLHKEFSSKIIESSLPDRVSPFNLVAGIASLNHKEFYYSTIAMVIKGRNMLNDGLVEMGCTVYKGQTNSIMFNTHLSGKIVRDSLREYGINIKLLKGVGFDDMLSVAVGSSSENRLFLKALRSILSLA